MAVAATETLPQCPTGSLIRWTDSEFQIINARCHTWRCPECGPRKAQKLARRIMATSARRFVTLTVRIDPRLAPTDLLDTMNRAWRALWKRVRRLQGPRARGYVRIVELTKQGTPHLHLALDCDFLPQRTLSRWWQELTGSSIVDIRVIRSQRGLSAYLAKYLTKSHDVLARRRKWSSSKSFLPAEPKLPDSPGDLPGPWKWLKALKEPAAEALAGAYLVLRVTSFPSVAQPPPRAPARKHRHR